MTDDTVRMTRAEIEARLDDCRGRGNNMLRRVIDLHTPDGAYWAECQGCDMEGFDANPPEWPCRTIEAILGHPVHIVKNHDEVPELPTPTLHEYVEGMTPFQRQFEAMMLAQLNESMARMADWHRPMFREPAPWGSGQGNQYVTYSRPDLPPKPEPEPPRVSVQSLQAHAEPGDAIGSDGNTGWGSSSHDHPQPRFPWDKPDYSVVEDVAANHLPNA